jgi:hypothetical protein
MPSDVPKSRADRIRAVTDKAGKTADNTGKHMIQASQARELLKLYEQLPHAIVAAREAFKVANEQSTGMAFEKFRELDARVEAIIRRINEILG